jgi:hypothetical protein
LKKAKAIIDEKRLKKTALSGSIKIPEAFRHHNIIRTDAEYKTFIPLMPSMKLKELTMPTTKIKPGTISSPDKLLGESCTPYSVSIRKK